jgi:hypothetical protein
MFGTREPSTLWCPFVRVREFSSAENAEPVINREISGRPDRGSMCLGAGCASWRWDEPAGDSERRRGFCGLAGPLAFLEQQPPE